MRLNQFEFSVPLIVVAFASGGWIHGIPTFEGRTWQDALARVPCQDVVRDGHFFRISAQVVVDGKPFKDPVIKDDELIRELEARCFARR
jgi:hypothetical protein